MLKRAKISVTRRKSKTIIFFLFLFIVANLVLSSISIKNATEESMKMARVSLGSEVILQTDMEKIRDEFMNNKDNEQSTDENKKDDMKNMHNAMDESTATINDVNKLKEISYVTDVKYCFNVNATEKSFSLYESSKEDDNNNDRPEFDKKMNSGLQVKAINTFKLEDNYVNGTIKLTSGEAFDETKDDTVIISYELATENNLKVGDKITITSSDDKDVELEIIGIYQNSETDKFNNNYNLIYVNTNTGAKLLTEEEYEEIRKGCHSYNLPLSVDSLNAGDVLAATKKDKKMEAGHIKFILMDGIGKSFIDKTVTDEELLQAIREILI